MSSNQNTPNPKKGENTPPKSNEASTTPTEAKATIGTLKPTPTIEIPPQEQAKAEKLKIELQVEDTLDDIKKLMQLSKQYNTTDYTLNRLKDFQFSQEDEENYGAVLSIKDSKRQEFETKNPRLVEALVKALRLILEDKKTELSAEITKVRISL